MIINNEIELTDKNGKKLELGQKIKCLRYGDEIIGTLMFGREVVSAPSDPYEHCEIIGLYIKYDNGAVSDSICEYEQNEIEIL